MKVADRAVRPGFWLLAFLIHATLPIPSEMKHSTSNATSPVTHDVLSATGNFSRHHHGQRHSKSTNLQQSPNIELLHFPNLLMHNQTTLDNLTKADSVNLLNTWNTSTNEAIFNVENKTRSMSFTDLELFEFFPGQVILVTFYSITSIVSIIVNTLTVLVLLKPDRSITADLWKFLVLLCISDIFLSIFCIPTTYIQVMKQRWIFPNTLCPVINFAQASSVFISIWTLVAIGIDRYMALIINPLYLMHWIQRYRVFIIGLICVLGAAFGSVQLFVSEAVIIERNGLLVRYCQEQILPQYSAFYTIFIFVCTFALPLVILCFVYMTIFRQILTHSAPGNPNQSRDQNQYKQKTKVLQLLIVIVFLFFLCWCPINVFNLLVEFKKGFLHPRSHSSFVLFYSTFFTCHSLAMSHSIVNPIVYCFMSDNFRAKMLSMFWRIKTWFTFNSFSSENIELNVQGETITSRTRKTNTKHAACKMDNNHLRNNDNNRFYLNNHNYNNSRKFQNQDQRCEDYEPEEESQQNSQIEVKTPANFLTSLQANS